MQKSDIRILIIEDDATLGKAVEEGLKRAGYTPTLASSYAEAKNYAKISDFHGLVVDCMIPQKSGVDIALEIIQDSERELVVILTSGIFKTLSFSHEAQIKTKAKAFLNKPFDIQELIQHFNEAFQSIVEEDRGPLLQLLAREQYSVRDKINAINQTEFVHGFNLPYIYSLLLDPQITGDLQIQYDNDKLTTIGFHQGNIDKVLHDDTESYFGVLLIEKGFTTPDALEAGLNRKDNKPIGERLVASSHLSPHAIEIIQMEQMNIRLSKTIQDTSVRIKFIESQKKETSSSIIDAHNFTEFLSDWICSKISPEWMRSFYNAWLENPILNGPHFDKIKVLKDLPAIQGFPSQFNENQHSLTLQELISRQSRTEEALLRALHFALLQRLVVFGSRGNSNENFSLKASRLKKILANTEGKNHFDVLGVSQNARPTEINRAYHELAKTLHPDKLSPESPQELRELAQIVFSRITEAYQTLNNDKRREEYKKTLALGHAEEVLKSESVFEEGLRHLRARRFRDARKSFHKTTQIKGHRSDAIVYFIWAYIKERRHRTETKELSEKVKNYLNQVPHEERHSAPYFLIKGMHYELSGQIQKSYQSLKHCLVLDPSFLDAKRELTYIKQHYGKKKGNTLSHELTSVMTKIFGRKSG